MHAVLFEVLPSAAAYQRYLDIAASLRPRLDAIDGFVSIERFRRLDDPRWLLSLSFWQHEAALAQWRAHGEHHAAQVEGRQAVFEDYRIRVVRFGPGSEAKAGAPHACVGLLQQTGGSPPEGARSYASLAHGDRLAHLFECDARGRLALPADAMQGIVLRDYGMRDRAQAPQQFADDGAAGS